MDKIKEIFGDALIIPATIFIVVVMSSIFIWAVSWLTSLSFGWALFVFLFLWGIIWGILYLFGASLMMPLIELAPSKEFAAKTLKIAFGVNNFILLVIIWTRLPGADIWMKILYTLFLASFTYSLMRIIEVIETGKLPADTKKS